MSEISHIDECSVDLNTYNSVMPNRPPTPSSPATPTTKFAYWREVIAEMRNYRIERRERLKRNRAVLAEELENYAISDTESEEEETPAKVFQYRALYGEKIFQQCPSKLEEAQASAGGLRGLQLVVHQLAFDFYNLTKKQENSEVTSTSCRSNVKEAPLLRKLEEEDRKEELQEEVSDATNLETPTGIEPTKIDDAINTSTGVISDESEETKATEVVISEKPENIVEERRLSEDD